MSKKKKVAHIRLSNGDEIIAQIEKDNLKELIITKPMVVEEKSDQQGNQSIILSKYLMDAGILPIHIKKMHVVTVTDVIEEIEKYYYNSMLYSATFLEKQILEAIDRTNEMMEAQLYNVKKLEEMKKNTPTMKKKIFHFSNTLH